VTAQYELSGSATILKGFMTQSFEKMGQEAAAFQKLILENVVKTTQAALHFAPGTPPELLRQTRARILESWSESWDKFLRSPQFLDGMRQWMDNAISFRKISNEFLGRMRNDMQAPSRSDIDSVLLAVRHMEKRLLDRLDELSDQIVRLHGNRHESARPVSPRRNGKKSGVLREHRKRSPKGRPA
jgi:hypothetical protein